MFPGGRPLTEQPRTQRARSRSGACGCIGTRVPSPQGTLGCYCVALGTLELGYGVRPSPFSARQPGSQESEGVYGGPHFRDPGPGLLSGPAGGSGSPSRRYALKVGVGGKGEGCPDCNTGEDSPQPRVHKGKWAWGGGLPASWTLRCGSEKEGRSVGRGRGALAAPPLLPPALQMRTRTGSVELVGTLVRVQGKGITG